jgi:hypothetical protein
MTLWLMLFTRLVSLMEIDLCMKGFDTFLISVNC